MSDAPVDFFTVSASAIKTHRMCPRKNAFERYVRLPRVPKGHFAFGTTLHECVERWLLADDIGRDAEGNPVDIYPDGWDKAVSPQEAAQIKRLIDMAITAGHLVRFPGRQVERQMGMDPKTGDGEPFWVVPDEINMFGFIDIDLPMAIDDLKTTKSPKYLLGQKRLKTDTQMLIYGKFKLEEIRKRGEVPPNYIELSHIAFCKDPKNEFTRKTTVEVTPTEIDAAWSEVKVDAEAMREVKRKVDRGDEWHDLEGPAKGSNACGAYGGCDFQPICGGGETVDEYSARVNRIRENPKNAHLHLPPQSCMRNPDLSGIFRSLDKSTDKSNPTTPNQGDDVSLKNFKDRLKSKAGAAASAQNGTAATATATNPFANQSEEKAAAEEQAHRADNAAPWYVDGCSACSDNVVPGFNSKGNPCGVCTQMQRKAGGPLPKDYDFGVGADKVPWWSEATDTPVEPEPVEPDPVTEAAAEEVVEQSEVSVDPQDKPKRGRGRPKKTDEDRIQEEVEERTDPWHGIIPKGKKRATVGHTLLLGAAPARTDRMCLDLAVVFEALKNAAAKDAGVVDFYKLDTWGRREKLHEIAVPFLDGVSKRFSPNALIYCTSGCPDLKALIDGLACHVDEVIVGANA